MLRPLRSLCWESERSILSRLLTLFLEELALFRGQVGVFGVPEVRLSTRTGSVVENWVASSAIIDRFGEVGEVGHDLGFLVSQLQPSGSFSTHVLEEMAYAIEVDVDSCSSTRLSSPAEVDCPSAEPLRLVGRASDGMSSFREAMRSEKMSDRER